MSTPNDFSHAAPLPVAEFAPLANDTSALPATLPPDPNNPPWGLAAAAFVWAASIVLLGVLPAMAVIPYAFLKNPGASGEFLKQFLLTDKTALFIQIVTIFPAHLLTLAVIWSIVTGFGKRPFWRTLGWSWSENFTFWKSGALALALLVFAILITKLIGGEETQLDQIVASSMGARIATALLATLTAPLVEEMIYRGVIYSALQKAIGALWAVIGVASLFALVHVLQYSNNLGVITAVALLSLTLTIVRAKSGRLLPCFIIHLVFNGIQSTYIILQPFIERSVASSGEQKTAALLGLFAQTVRAIF